MALEKAKTEKEAHGDRVIPFFDSHEVRLLRMLTGRGSEYCGNPERNETKSPQTNGICERFHKTVLNEFYRVAFRKKVYRFIDELQADLDVWIHEYKMRRGSIKGAGASARRRCKRSLTQCR